MNNLCFRTFNDLWAEITLPQSIARMWMMKLGAFLLAAGFASLAAAAGAEPTSLAGDELRRAVSGKTVYLNVSGFELPIHYGANGRIVVKWVSPPPDFRGVSAHPTMAAGGSRTTSCASAGPAGWRGSPTATSLHVRARPCSGFAMTAAPAPRGWAAEQEEERSDIPVYSKIADPGEHDFTTSA